MEISSRLLYKENGPSVVGFVGQGEVSCSSFSSQGLRIHPLFKGTTLPIIVFDVTFFFSELGLPYRQGQILLLKPPNLLFIQNGVRKLNGKAQSSQFMWWAVVD